MISKLIAPLITIFIIASLFSQCSKNRDIIEFQNKTKTEIIDNIDGFLKHMNYKNFKIFAIVHGNYSGNVLSKKVNDERFSGFGYVPENRKNRNTMQTPVYRKADDQYAMYNKRELIANYDENHDNTYEFEYISVLIVFDKINKKNSIFIKEAIENTFLNKNRNDTISIISKN